MLQIIQDWVTFLELLGPQKDNPLDFELLSQSLKVPQIEPLNFKEIERYYHNEFTQQTIKAQRTKWHEKDKYLFIWCVTKMVELEGEKFHQSNANRCFPTLSKVLNLTEKFLREKWYSLLKTSVKQQPWSPEEDSLLIELKRKYPGNKQWTQLTMDFNTATNSSRYPKQIRERWNNVKNPSIKKQQFTQEEALTLFQGAKQFSRKWAKINQFLPGRTDNQIKNYYNSTMKKLCKALGFSFVDQQEELLNMIIFKQSFDVNTLKDQIEQHRKCFKVEEQPRSMESYQPTIPVQPFLNNLPPMQQFIGSPYYYMVYPVYPFCYQG